MKTGLILFAAAVLTAVCCDARFAEKVSEDENFVVYRIPVRALDLQTQATGQYEGYELGPSVGRSSSKSTSHSKSTSSSTGTGKGKGYGEGGSSEGHGTGYGGSSSGHGYGGSSGGHGYGSGGPAYGGGSSGGGYGQGGYSSGQGTGYGSSGSGGGYGGSYRGGHSPSYAPNYDSGSHGPSSHYDDEEDGAPKVITTTKTVTTNSAQDTGLDKVSNYRQTSDSLGDIRFKLGDYLKNAPGHEGSMKYGSFFQGASSEFNPGYRSGQGFNVNEFTRTLNQGALNAPSFRSSKYVPQASIIVPRAYALRHSGFGFPMF